MRPNEHFALTLISNWYQTGNPSCFHHKQLFDVEEFTEDRLIKNITPDYFHFVKMNKIQPCFNNFKILTTKIYVLLVLKLCC